MQEGNLSVFVSLGLSYFLLACLRKSLSISLPFLIERERELDSETFLSVSPSLSKVELGLISSGFALGFGFSKLFGSVLSDYVPAKFLLCGSLFFASLSAIIFSLSLDVKLMVLAWSVHGFSQGLGWPSISSLIYTHFPSEVRGSVWSTITSVGNVGYLLSPVLLFPFTVRWGYQVSSKMTFFCHQ